MQNDKLRALSDKEQAIKKLPVYYGSYDNYYHGFKETINNSIDEILRNFDSGEVYVILHEDNRTVTVEDTGRGLPIADIDENDVPNTFYLFEKMFAGSKYDDNDRTDGGTNGVGMTVLNYSSELFIAEVWNRGRHYITEYSNGDIAKELTDLGETDKHGTKITFRLNPEVYTETTFDGEFISTYLDKTSKASHKITINYTYYKNGEVIKKIFNYSSLEEYFNEHESNRMIKSIGNGVKEYNYNNEKNTVELILNCSQSEKLLQETMLNSIDLIEPNNNSIRNGVLDGVKEFVHGYCQKEKLYNKNEKELIREDVEQAITFVCRVLSTKVEFEGQTKFLTKKALYGRIVREYIKEVLEVYSVENKDDFYIMVKQILICKRARERSELSRQNIKKSMNNANKKKPLPSKLKDAELANKKPELCELFIVEGDSAGGGTKEGCDGEFQGVLSSRGKILNVVKQGDKVSMSEELKNFEGSIGMSAGEEYDINKLRYHKIMLLQDADSDGGHIRSLWLAYLFRYYKELILNNHVYACIPPLYKNTMKNGEKIYKYNEEEQEVFLKDNNPTNIQRYKGLGEMDAEELGMTTLDPKTRRIKVVTIEDCEEANNLIEILMGKDVEPRKVFIKENSKLATLDI